MDRKILIVFCLAAGSMDLATGSLLVVFPEWTLSLMKVPTPGAECSVFLRFVGTFVGGVGSLYLLSLIPVCLRKDWGAVRYCFGFTGWLRTLVFIFGSTAILLGWLPWQWISVPICDGLLAVFQFAVLARRRIPRSG